MTFGEKLKEARKEAGLTGFCPFLHPKEPTFI